jgi:hypothetical protein
MKPNRLLEAIEPNIDKFGYIAQLDGDGGDTVLHEADFVFVSYMLWRLGKISLSEYTAVKYRFILRIEHLERYGLIRRHVDTARWYGDYKRGSTDQYYSLIGMAVSGLKGRVSRVIKAHALRLLLFASNIYGNTDTPRIKFPDLMGFGFWGTELRCSALSGSKIAPGVCSLLLPVLDLSLIVNSFFRAVKRELEKEKPIELRDVDVRNHLKALLLANEYCPTKLSRLALHEVGTAEELKLELRTYFRKETGGVYGLGELWCEVIDEVFK